MAALAVAVHSTRALGLARRAKDLLAGWGQPFQLATLLVVAAGQVRLDKLPQHLEPAALEVQERRHQLLARLSLMQAAAVVVSTQAELRALAVLVAVVRVLRPPAAALSQRQLLEQQTLVAAVVEAAVQAVARARAALAALVSLFYLCRQLTTPEPQLARRLSPHLAATPSSSSRLQGATQHEHV